MKKVTYYCDICKKEIQKHSGELEPCNRVMLAEVSTWDDDATKKKLYKDIRVCNDCIKEINCHVDNMVVTNENFKRTIFMDPIGG